MDNIKLIEPSIEIKELVDNFIEDYKIHNENHINGSSGLIKYEDYYEWLELIENQKTIIPSNLETPAFTYFLLRESDNKIIGSIQLRLYLTDELEVDGGNIGYGIAPSERGKGYGTKQLELVIEKAREFNLESLLITCNKTNNSSANVAMKNNGVFIGEGYSPRKETVTEKYLINLK